MRKSFIFLGDNGHNLNTNFAKEKGTEVQLEMWENFIASCLIFSFALSFVWLEDVNKY